MGYEKRRASRKSLNLLVNYAVTEVNNGHVTRVEVTGEIIDFSEYGFGLLTSYPLQRGHVITVDNKKAPFLPSFGIVKWVKRVNNLYRAGLGLRYRE